MRFTTVIFFALSSALFGSCRLFIGQEHAVKLAEDFIRRNGYTSMPIDTSRCRLSFTMIDHILYGNTDSVLKNRYNTLYPKAFCVSHPNFLTGWYVGFLSTKVVTNKLDSNLRKSDLPGQAVLVSDNCHVMRMVHEDPLFSYWKKL